ncbi:MAG TPA: zf-HC2 domain-containing protein [Candidatus Binatia bacterium]|nr:zf-HC2 domain-containing protein [Candidatus Binatia bacterium]
MNPEASREHAEDRLALLLGGELPAGERDAVERHLAGCAPCRTARRELAELRESLAALAPPPVDWSAYRADLGRRLARGGPGTARHWSWWQVPLPAALAAGLVAALLYAGSEPPLPRVSGVDPAALDAVALASRLDLISRFDLVERLDMLEDFDVIDRLDREAPNGKS